MENNKEKFKLVLNFNSLTLREESTNPDIMKCLASRNLHRYCAIVGVENPKSDVKFYSFAETEEEAFNDVYEQWMKNKNAS
jgi:hypothetical protein